MSDVVGNQNVGFLMTRLIFLLSHRLSNAHLMLCMCEKKAQISCASAQARSLATLFFGCLDIMISQVCTPNFKHLANLVAAHTGLCLALSKTPKTGYMAQLSLVYGLISPHFQNVIYNIPIGIYLEITRFGISQFNLQIQYDSKWHHCLVLCSIL